MSSAQPWLPASILGAPCRPRPRVPRRPCKPSSARRPERLSRAPGAGRALAEAAEAERLSELALAGEALDLAETTGAPPGPVLAGVAAAAVDRVRARRTMMAATAQARLSARVVAAMAPAFLAVLVLTSPSDAAFLVREPLGWGTLATAAILESLGICWASRIVRGPAP
jgi:tight adherence protein B